MSKMDLSLKLCFTLHEEHSYAAYLSGKVHLDRGDRLCLVCRSSQVVEDEQRFFFDCLAYAPLRLQSADLFQQGFQYSSRFLVQT